MLAEGGAAAEGATDDRRRADAGKCSSSRDGGAAAVNGMHARAGDVSCRRGNAVLWCAELILLTHGATSVGRGSNDRRVLLDEMSEHALADGAVDMHLILLLGA